MELWIGFFLFYSIMHPIADFIVQNKMGKKWHYLLTLNPLHVIWDKLFSFHNGYIGNYDHVMKVTVRINYRDDETWSFFNEKDKAVGIVLTKKFWWRLGVDQLAHVLLNLVWAVMSVYILVTYFPTSPLLTP